ncbi:DUF5995 family protein [Flavobacterium sp. 17A]|uniref:DUF5995 family protein n=1 Tax=Flavobacterium potami TaxID=2872310 RepID=A0A9X1KSB8_9FLAO|nr:DUF5995 family protein [Flavobacterium potami]MBZ4037435.1 DUF5995 family protein [Flavobacterium potami]
MTPYVPANTIKEVLSCLEAIITEAEATNSRLGYFAALYHKVTLKVDEDIQNRLFENPERLELLDVLFANRYLYALHEWKIDKNSTKVSKSWKIAFESSENSSILILQHLFLGMNAHINYDLGIAVKEANDNGCSIDELRRDYNAINNILSSLTYSVINKLNIVSPLISLIGLTGNKSNSLLVQFSLGNARDGAWCFATDLISKEKSESETFINQRDSEMEQLGALLITNKGLLKIGVFFIHLFEWRKVNKIIGVLSSKKPYLKEIIKPS